MGYTIASSSGFVVVGLYLPSSADYKVGLVPRYKENLVYTSRFSCRYLSCDDVTTRAAEIRSAHRAALNQIVDETLQYDGNKTAKKYCWSSLKIMT